MEIDWKKKYEEALNKARELHGTVAAGRDFLAEIFPELAESEGERNEKIRKQLISSFDYEMSKYGNVEWEKGIFYRDVIAWLEKQKDSPMPEDTVIFQKGVAEGRRLEREEQKSEWSKEDERMLSRCIKSVESSKNFAESQTFKEAKDKEKDWLKSLPERFNLQLKQEWSDEDILYYNAVMEMVMYSLYLPSRPRNEVIKWLKSLKNRGNFPKSNDNSHSWKPSEEQMDLFGRIVNDLKIKWVGVTIKEQHTLESLYDDLKKLM